MKGEALTSSSFRIMTEGDVPSVVEIEKGSFREPWGRESFLRMLGGGQGSTCVVLESGGEVVGYFVVELHAASTRIVNLAIHPDHRRRGHATRCLGFIHKLARRALEIAASRDIALQPLVGSRPAQPWEGSPRTDAEPWKLRRKVAGALDEHVGEIHLEVGECNLAAQLLYRKMGYRATKVLRNYYPALGEDAYKMVRKICSSA